MELMYQVEQNMLAWYAMLVIVFLNYLLLVRRHQPQLLTLLMFRMVNCYPVHILLVMVS